MKVDIDAPIVPGISAGGIYLNLEFIAIQESDRKLFEINSSILESINQYHKTTHYISENIDLWIDKNGVVYQIMVHDKYNGKVHGVVGLGSTLAEVRRMLGPIIMPMEDFELQKIKGISFEPEDYDEEAPITQIYVFVPDAVDELLPDQPEWFDK